MPPTPTTQFENQASSNKIAYKISVTQSKLLIQVIQVKEKNKDIPARTQISKKINVHRKEGYTGIRPQGPTKKRKKEVDIRKAEMSPEIQESDDEE